MKRDHSIESRAAGPPFFVVVLSVAFASNSFSLVYEDCFVMPGHNVFKHVVRLAVAPSSVHVHVRIFYVMTFFDCIFKSLLRLSQLYSWPYFFH